MTRAPRQHLVAALEARLRKRESGFAASSGPIRAVSRSMGGSDGGSRSALGIGEDESLADLLSDHYPDVTVIFADVARK